ncbi:MAG TPA: Fur family transcriptional regulator [Candidatus Kryptonia bacterium]|nr:Fur family transcriptional regulator [Candidatus Kryptonia bacterium]
MERRIEQFMTAARAAGVKLTHQRLEVFREVASSLEHPDAEMLLRGIQARMPTVSLDTVYRTLWLLNDLGLISTLGPRRDSARFDANLARHHHYVCVRCGLVRDFESAALDRLSLPAAKHFGSVVDTHIEVRGICRTCARERADEPTRHGRKPTRGMRRNKT